MKNALKSELYKLFTIRSTYIISFLAIAFSTFMSFYVEGYSGHGTPLDSHKMADVVFSAPSIISLLLTIVAILHITSEYRNNTIMYTLSAANSRIKVLLAKIISVSLFSIGLSLLITGVVLTGTIVGLKLHHFSLPAQEFNTINILARVVYYELAITLFSMLIAVVARNVTAALIMVMIVVSTVESLLGIIVKHNYIYFPYRSLSFVLSKGTPDDMPHLTPLRAAVVFSLYLIVGWLLAGYLFMHRDAN